MMAFKPIALLFALFILSSCAYAPDNSVFTGGRCITGADEHLQGVDWETATKLNLRIRQDDFLPVYLGLQQNESYLLAIENADDSSHTFRAMEFFRAVAVGGVRTDGGEFTKVPCLKGVSIPSGKVTEIRFVAIRDGSYEFDDNALMFSMAMVGSAGGFITIEPPRYQPVKPLNFLKLFDRKPIERAPLETKPSGLFDDQQETPPPAPGGLFDDQEQPPSEQPSAPPSGLFDDPAPEQPIDGSPSVPVEPAPGPSAQPVATPTESLFDTPSLQPSPEKPQAPVVDAPSQAAPTESMFDEPSLQPVPDKPEAPALDTPPLPESSESMFDEPSLEPLPEKPELPVGSVTPDTPPEPMPAESLDTESDMMMEEVAPVADAVPELPEAKTFDPEEELLLEEAPAIEGTINTLDATTQSPVLKSQPAPQSPVATPPGYQPMDGPPADIFSDPPDVVNSGPGGAAGSDRLDGSG